MAFDYSDEKNQNIKKMISPERLSPYAMQSGGNLHSAILIYEWNTTLSESLYRPLQSLEIALRNSIHDVLSTAYSREDWYTSIDGLLKYHHPSMLNSAIEKVIKRRREVTPGRVVAELSLGFWAGLLGSVFGMGGRCRGGEI
ncbi:MAG: Abi family protein [Magnetococcales bacterium]|nr:Abi family protein [Magnetococcales bacterium]